MANVARRSFLKLIGAAPIAGPVVAKEAAAKMGMSSLLGGAGAAMGGSGEALLRGGLNKQEGSWLDWAQAELRNVFSERNVAEMRRRVIRNGEARLLDADLASMRSASPAAAYQLQIERCVARGLENERLNWLERIRDHSSQAARAASG